MHTLTILTMTKELFELIITAIDGLCQPWKMFCKAEFSIYALIICILYSSLHKRFPYLSIVFYTAETLICVHCVTFFNTRLKLQVNVMLYAVSALMITHTL